MADSIFDRVLNPTIGLPQQLVWRIWRALKEEDIDLFSKKGLLDPALVPLFGAAFSQKNAVEARELFGDSFGAQLAGSIATDPLTYLTGGLTALAKGGRAVNKIARFSKFSKAHPDIIKDLDNITLGKFRTVVENYLGKATDLTAKEQKKIRTWLEQVPEHSTAVDTVADLVKRGSDHELAIGLPIIGKATGIEWALPTYMNSWWEVSKKGMGLGLRGLMKPLAYVPGVGSVYDSIASAGKAFNQGRDAATRPVLRQIAAYDNPEGFFGLTAEEAAKILQPSTTRLGERVARRHRDMPRIFAKALESGKSVEEALTVALGHRLYRDPIKRARSIRKAREEWATILNPTGLSSQEVRLPSSIDDLYKRGNRFLMALESARDVVTSSEAVPVGAFSETSIKHSKAFRLGKSTTETLRKAFRSDITLRGLAKVGQAFNQRFNQYSQGAKEVERQLYALVASEAERLGVSKEFLLDYTGTIMEADPSINELNTFLREGFGSAKDAKAALRAASTQLLDRYPAQIEQARFLIQKELKTATDEGKDTLQFLLDDLEAMVKGSPLDPDGVSFTPAMLEAEGATRVPGAPPPYRSKLDLQRPYLHRILSGGKLRKRRLGDMTAQELEAAKDSIWKRLDRAADRDLKPATIEKYERDLEAIEAEILDRSHARTLTGEVDDLSGGRPADLLDREEAIRARVKDRVLRNKGTQPDEILPVEVFGDLTPLSVGMVELEDGIKQMERWITQHGDDGNLAIPPAMLDELSARLENYHGHLRERYHALLGKNENGVNLLDAVTEYQSLVLKEAVRTGLYRPGAPLASFTRMIDPRAAKAVRALLGTLPEDQMLKVTPTMTGFFRRKSDRMSLMEVAELHKTLLNEGSKKGKETADQLREILAAEGLDLDQVFTTDPVAALTNRFMEMRITESTEQFFNDALRWHESSEAGFVGGKIVGVVDDAGNTVDFEKLRLARRKAPVDEAGDAAVEGTHTLAPEMDTLSENYQAIVIKTDEGRQVVVPRAMLDTEGFGMTVFQPTKMDTADNLGAVAADSLARGTQQKFKYLPSGRGLADLEGKHVLYGPEGVIDSVVGTIGQHNKNGHWLIKTVYDPVHTFMKFFQTVARPAFWTANFVSSFFQAGLAGVGPRAMLRGVGHAARFLSDDPEIVSAYNKLIRFTALPGKAKTGMLGFESERTARVISFLGGAEDAPRRYFQIGDQRIDILDFLEAGAESGALTGTFAVEGFKSTGNLNHALEIARKEAGLGASPAAEKWLKLRGAAQTVGETSELFVRYSMAFGAIEQGLDIHQAWDMVAQAMVDYGGLTRFEKNVMKRLSSYYTFPRKFIPFAWDALGKDPRKAALTLNAAFKNDAVDTRTGTPTLHLGSYRFSIDRVMPQMYVPQLMASIADRLFDIRGTTAEGRVPDVYEPGGILQVIGLDDVLVGRADSAPEQSTMEEAMRLTWLTNWIVARDNPRIHESALDSVAKTLFGVRKVEPGHERRMLAANYRRLMDDLRYQAQREPDPADRAAIFQEAEEISQTVTALMLR